MNTWITSDLHFGHSNIMKFCPENRGHFSDVDHMNRSMIDEWNSKVEDGDLVYILGDVAFLPVRKAVEILTELKGDKILIEGNHDRKLLEDLTFRREFYEVHKYLDIRYACAAQDGKKHNVVMFHFPIWEWDRMHHGAIHFFGHVHGGYNPLRKYRARDVGYDATGKVVSLMDDMIVDACHGVIRSHHDKYNT